MNKKILKVNKILRNLEESYSIVIYIFKLVRGIT